MELDRVDLIFGGRVKDDPAGVSLQQAGLKSNTKVSSSQPRPTAPASATSLASSWPSPQPRPRLASASADKLLRVWSLAYLSLFAELEGHEEGVSGPFFSPDGCHLASASDGRTDHIWDLGAGSGACLAKTLVGYINYAFCIAFSPHGNVLSSGSFDETVRVWEVRSGRSLRVLPAHSEPVTTVDFCREGAMIVSGSYDGLCRIWDSKPKFVLASTLCRIWEFFS